jgi:hypothetical protein
MLSINVIHLWSTAYPLIKINAGGRGSGRPSALAPTLAPQARLTDKRRPSIVPDVIPALSHTPHFGEV